MTSLFIITLVAFALLALIIIVLVKTTRFRPWQGVLVFLLPLILANLLWFSWLQPRQQHVQQREQVVQLLTQTPGYRVLQTQEPALWQLLVQELQHKTRMGESPQQALGELRGWLANVINRRLMRAPDAAVVKYIAVSVQEMQALNNIDPQLCFRYLYPQVNGGVNLEKTLSPALNQQDAQAMEKLLLGSTGDEQQIDKAAAQRDLQNIVATLYKKWGDKLQQLNMPADTAVDRSSRCAMSIDLYSAILALPARQAANLLRRMIALTG
ncbi:MAG: hypothetical protein QRY16_11900 [Enterobacterales bacterium endosymbiont of Blomia tropicalis]|uniref:hypothetical protein n=1 Tax=Mixta mediterraneensis TaxID=2758443 RepID=UPI0025A6F3A8|nr:hypothetical protein [Mixta mediterraneensis]MDL4914460.1 hypothetical protein [Mixta mediterraneensis]